MKRYHWLWISGIALLFIFFKKDMFNGLHPVVVAKARQLIKAMQAQGIVLTIHSGFRSPQEQSELYAKGRTKPGKKVTNADAWQSWHNYGLAFDVVPIVNGKKNWVSPYWQKIGKAGERLNLIWGGSFKNFKGDFGHFEYHPALTLAKAKKRVLFGQPLLL